MIYEGEESTMTLQELQDYVLQMGNQVIENQSNIRKLQGVVNALGEQTGVPDDIVVDIQMNNTVPGPFGDLFSNKPTPKEPEKPSVVAFLTKVYSQKEGEKLTYGQTTFEMLVPVALAVGSGTGLLRIHDSRIAGGYEDVGIRCAWIVLAITHNFLDDLINEVTQPSGKSWRTEYTKKPDGWYHLPFTKRRFGENRVTGLIPDETQTAPSGKQYFVSCDDTKPNGRA